MPLTDVRPKAESRTLQVIRPAYQARLSDRDYLKGIRRQLDSSGVVCLTEFLSQEAVTRLQEEVLKLEGAAERRSNRNNRKWSVKGAMLRGTVIDELAKSALVLKMINGVLREGSENQHAVIGKPIDSSEVVPGINIMRGPGDVTGFHFDGTFLNILVPVFIPTIDGPNRGQLTIYPNIRSFRKNLYDRLVVPFMCRLKLFRMFFRRVEIDYEVGNVYLFYGYRSLHGVLSPAAAGLRCTTNMTVGARRFA